MQEDIAQEDLAALFSPAKNREPQPLLARLREHAPVVKAEAVGLWVLTRHADVVFALKRPDLFSSGRDAALVRRFQDPRLEQSMNLLSDNSIVAVDPPEHTRLRKLINSAFTPRAIQRLESRIRTIASELIDDILDNREFDLIEALAIPLPVIVIAEMLGVDPARQADFKRWSDDLLAGSTLEEPLDDAEIERVLASRSECVDYFHELIDLRRRAPCEDLLSDLVRAEVDHQILSPDEVVTMAVILMIAGNETTTNLIGAAMLEILEHPEQLRWLRADLSLIPNFLEEVLRFRSPVPMLVRIATQDVSVCGVTIPKGEAVALMIDSANRDPARVRDPERFDITRDDPTHLSFGYGIHFCVGAPLSRLEAKIAFEEMFRRFPSVSRVPGPTDWLQTGGLRGLRSLRLCFDAHQ